ncbi:L-fucose:H+ symporter permease [Hymenobacter sp. 15J16-1T3B]|uniref:L-fucose:H+ symporter permease n=1 Tax=Hymenobacter sp. 15J16-1T3B TaxID=2886941 RepID=UPI001D12CAC8|nr:L-fucose:H+ symporter permease [Hymenobacter sp. 15J16-1T3B]MCC3160409.1 L-fucose:H+ symporter permease [Hymenobacter sp. 15J16-1T3B]
MALAPAPTPPPVATGPAGSRSYVLPFILVVGVFFLWGMAHNLDSILIPHLKKACQLNNRQSTLVDTAVFLAYFLMAIPAGMLLQRLGYKRTIILGLLAFAGGAFLFVPAADSRSYGMFLTALFIIGCGLTTLETAANPYAAVLGPPEGSTSRLNLAASFNGLAAFVAPVIGANMILSGKEFTEAQLAAMPAAERVAYLTHEAAAVKLPYLVLGGVLVAVAALFFFSKLPEVKAAEAEPSQGGGFFAVLKHRHLSWAVVAQFFYVGAQVCVTSFFIRMAKQGAGVDEITAGYYLGMYGLLFMAGRFIGTALLKVVPSQRLLSLYAVIAVALCAVAVFGDGAYVIYALGALGFFMSIMFPTIFALGIAGLGDDTKPGSSWLVMSIVGGAIMPYLMGTLIDLRGDNIQIGYLIPLGCFLVILLFGQYGYRINRKLV